MKYICLGYHDERAWAALDPQQRAQLEDASCAYGDALQRRGNVLEAIALHPARQGVTLRFDRGNMTVTDGPFVETKEQLGGFMLLEATDLNHAISLMAQLPCMQVGGSVEIRPINEALSTLTSPAIESVSLRT